MARAAVTATIQAMPLPSGRWGGPRTQARLRPPMRRLVVVPVPDPPRCDVSAQIVAQRERADLWMADAARRWRKGQHTDAITAALAARDALDDVIGTMRGWA